MRIKVLSGGRKNIELPLSDAELNLQMRQIGIEETVPMCRLVEVLEKNNPLHLLEGQTVNMDEVNFFAKRMDSLTEYVSTTPIPGFGALTSPIMVLFCIILMAYAVIKVFFANLKRGGILLIQIAVGSLYMFSVPRGYTDGFVQWCKQIVGLCLTAFLQSTILIAGLLVFKDHALLGLGLMLSAGEIPRIAGAFGLDTTTRANIMSAVYTAQAAVNTTKTVVAAVAK